MLHVYATSVTIMHLPFIWRCFLEFNPWWHRLIVFSVNINLSIKCISLSSQQVTNLKLDDSRREKILSKTRSCVTFCVQKKTELNWKKNCFCCSNLNCILRTCASRCIPVTKYKSQTWMDFEGQISQSYRALKRYGFKRWLFLRDVSFKDCKWNYIIFCKSLS